MVSPGLQMWRKNMNDLEMYREQLAICDDKIIDVLAERNSIIEKIMAYKEKYGMPILQPAQEEKQKRRLDEKLAGNKYQEEIEDFSYCKLSYYTIHIPRIP